MCTLRQRGYLLESDYERDKKVRSEAIKFKNAFQKWFKENPDGLSRSTDGAFYVRASKFWKHPRARKTIVIFAPRGGSSGDYAIAGGVGKLGQDDVIVFNVLLKPFSTEALEYRLGISIVDHEMAHFLDPGLFKGKKSSAQIDTQGDAAYFNNPSEWNAYWHEGAGSIERMLSNPSVQDNEEAKEDFFGDGSFKSFVKQVNRDDIGFWNRHFIKHMRKKTKRKFDKRLYQLWQGLKKQGLL